MASESDARRQARRWKLVVGVAFAVAMALLVIVPWVTMGSERAVGQPHTRRGSDGARITARWARDATSVTLVGDSVAASLGDGLIREGARRGLPVTSRAVNGCGVVRGTPTDDRFRPFPWANVCDGVVPDILSEVGADAPSVVLWLSSWETSNRVVDGRQIRIGTPRGDRRFLGLVDDAVRQLSRGGAHVVFVTLPHRTTRPGLTSEFFGIRFPVRRESGEERRAVDRVNRLLRQYAATRSGAVAVVDLDAIVCGTQRRCPFLTDGVALRPDDGRHFAGAGPEWVARRILDRLGVPAAAPSPLLRTEA